MASQKQTVWAVATEIKRETEKAFLVEFNGATWLPKSQVSIVKTDGGLFVELPQWLFFQNKSRFIDGRGVLLSVSAAEFAQYISSGELTIIETVYERKVA